jgi:hypothetical protein
MSWIDKYYGETWKQRLSPKVVFDGKYKAVVRVSAEGSVGFVLIQKNGLHGVTPQEVLFQGTPDAKAYLGMQARLAAVDRA